MKRTPHWVFVAAAGVQLAAMAVCVWAMEHWGRLEPDAEAEGAVVPPRREALAPPPPLPDAKDLFGAPSRQAERAPAAIPEPPAAPEMMAAAEPEPQTAAAHQPEPDVMTVPEAEPAAMAASEAEPESEPLPEPETAYSAPPVEGSLDPIFARPFAQAETIVRPIPSPHNAVLDALPVSGSGTTFGAELVPAEPQTAVLIRAAEPGPPDVAPAAGSLEEPSAAPYPEAVVGAPATEAVPTSREAEALELPPHPVFGPPPVRAAEPAVTTSEPDLGAPRIPETSAAPPPPAAHIPTEPLPSPVPTVAVAQPPVAAAPEPPPAPPAPEPPSVAPAPQPPTVAAAPEPPPAPPAPEPPPVAAAPEPPPAPPAPEPPPVAAAPEPPPPPPAPEPPPPPEPPSPAPPLHEPPPYAAPVADAAAPAARPSPPPAAPVPPPVRVDESAVAVDRYGIPRFISERADGTTQIVRAVSSGRNVVFGFYPDGDIRFVDVDGGRYAGKAESARARLREVDGTRAFTMQVGVSADGGLQAAFTGGMHDAEVLALEPLPGWNAA